MKPKHTEAIEIFLQETILPELENGRPGWDKPHTITVVQYLKDIIQHSPISHDYIVLLTAVYAHDWGYSGLFHKGEVLKLSDILSVKALHMEIGAKKIADLLKHSIFSELKLEQKSRIVHLVAVHDKLTEITEIDERILVEADTLGGLDTDQIKPFADKESSDRYIKGVEKKRIPLFITDYSKQKVQELIVRRKKYYEDRFAR